MKGIGGALAVLAAVCVPSVAFAAEGECGEDGERILRAAYPDDRGQAGKWTVEGRTITLPSETGGDPHAMICRMWRGRPGELLVAVPLIGEATADANIGDLDLLVVDRKGMKVRHRLRLKGAMDDDAIAVRKLSLDTAAYRLAAGRLAFGLRKAVANGSQPNPFSQTTLSLFEVRGGRLAPVLDGLTVAQNGGEWDTRCAGAFRRVGRTLTMVPGEPVAAIEVREVQVDVVAAPAADGGCRERETPRTRTVRLRFEGGRYAVPKEMRGL